VSGNYTVRKVLEPRGTLEIFSYSGIGDNISIPAEINGKRVTAIGEAAFHSKQLTNVDIPASVTAIRPNAFWGNQLTSIAFGNSVTFIGDRAFAGN
jgi:hypothetical protein